MKGRTGLAERRLASQRKFWEGALHGADPATIPADFAQAEVSPIAGTVPFRLAPETVAAMTAAAKEREALIFTLLVSGLKIVLRHYTGSSDVVVATGAHKDYAGAGLNQLLLLRDAIDRATPGRALVARLQKTIAAAFDHQAFPVARLVEERGLVPGAKALFQMAVLYDGVHDLRVLDDVAAEIVILVKRHGGEIGGEIRFREDRFRSQTLELLARHLDRAIAQLLAAPERAIGALRFDAPAIVTPERPDTSPVEPVHEWFRRTAAESPDALAIVGAAPCTYDRLHRRSNQLARWLMRVGVERGAAVAICYDHGTDAIVAILAVLKAGAAYVPLDPLQPPKRTALVLEDARPFLVLTQARAIGPLAETMGRAIDPAALEDAIAREDDSDVQRPCDPHDTAYVIYTSGSTGRPKGVAINHGALANYVAWAAEAYTRGVRGLTFALFSSMAFDLTVTSVFVPLVTGNAILPYSRTLYESAVPRIVEDGKADVVKLTPSHLSLLAERRYPNTRLRCLIVGGEALEVSLAARIHEAFDGRLAIVNEYGPTETTVGCTAHTFEPARDRRAFVPIGGPVAHARAHVLDDDGCPVDVNAVGELCIAGRAVGLGYLRNPAATAASFVPDPFADGARMYRTGDLARLLPGGAIEFVGRRDGQVKVQGHRVELEELRLTLNQHPQVRDSVICVRRDARGVDRLVAYYAARQEIAVSELRATMSESLPRDIVPQAYVHVRRLPLASNGKVDGRALPAFDEAIALDPASGCLDAQLAYWRAQLDGVPMLTLPVDAAADAAADAATACETASLAPATLARWQELCEREGITPHVLLVAAWAVVLARWSQQRDFAIGTVPTRGLPAIDGAHGSADAVLPLRLRIDPDAQVRALLRHVHEMAAEADAHRDVPFAQLVEAVAAPRDASRPPLVQAVLALEQAAEPAALCVPNGRAMAAADPATPFELALDATLSPDAAAVRLTYRRARFSADRVRQWLLELDAVVAAMAESAERPVSALPWLDDLQAARVRHGSAGPTHGAARAIIAQIAERADRRPDAIALAAGRASVTYRALERRATAFARTLRAHGVGPEVRVGVCMDRSVDLIAVLLAVWKAGGAFVLLDPASPRDRLAATIERARPRTIVAQARTEPLLPAGTGAAVLRLEATDVLNGLAFTATMPPYVFGETLACVVDAARPGDAAASVAITHGGLSNLVVYLMAVLELKPDDRVLQHAALDTGAAVSEIFTTLASGAALELPMCTPDGDTLDRFLAVHAITAARLPPALWSVLAPADLPALRTAVVDGACLRALAPAWRSRRLITTFGVPEATVCAAAGVAGERAGCVPAGRPIGNAQIYVLDAAQRLVPGGVSGEICIGGVGVARGYLRRPSLTADRFVPDPHGDVPGGRLFRTGERGHYDANGQLHVHHRCDVHANASSGSSERTCP